MLISLFKRVIMTSRSLLSVSRAADFFLNFFFISSEKGS